VLALVRNSMAMLVLAPVVQAAHLNVKVPPPNVAGVLLKVNSVQVFIPGPDKGLMVFAEYVACPYEAPLIIKQKKGSRRSWRMWMVDQWIRSIADRCENEGSDPLVEQERANVRCQRSGVWIWWSRRDKSEKAVDSVAGYDLVGLA
jgi:hypothetical protein